MKFGQKTFCEIDLFDFTSFFWPAVCSVGPWVYAELVMYSGSKSRGRVGGLLFGFGSGSGSIFQGRLPLVSGVLGFFQVKFRIGWRRGWFVFCFSRSGWVRGSNFWGRPPRVSGFQVPDYITNFHILYNWIFSSCVCHICKFIYKYFDQVTYREDFFKAGTVRVICLHIFF